MKAVHLSRCISSESGITSDFCRREWIDVQPAMQTKYCLAVMQVLLPLENMLNEHDLRNLFACALFKSVRYTLFV